jgi:hypothetical protein
VDAAKTGDRIRVSKGSWCGATIDKRVKLEGEGKAIIVGCAAPTLQGTLRIGFFLPDQRASGTQISDFVFDGSGIGNSNTSPLAFAIFARNADDVVVSSNEVDGTVQAVTNTGGSGWIVEHNHVCALSAFTCDGYCGGGSAIVFQQRATTLPRAVGNSAEHNHISGKIPDGLDEFSMSGIVIYGQDGASASFNHLAIPANPSAAGQGVGITVSDRCCADPVPFLTSIGSVITHNDGRASQIAVQVTLDATGGTGNSEGATIAHNKGVLDIDGKITTARRRLQTLSTLFE